ncbi:hypothetical protein ONE63_001852 [Megalurothrips usitatus]|uniref:Equilibrative nucleoside transporter 4 n=1 Tax=Megalurothrips usitatus TaxID=439358 RepID=A0AAV7XE19_9NEOP|nr:hypothetical protein ONE63_001852 [Megalurothrips usitatus]
MSALGMGAEIEDLDKVGMGYLMLDSKAHKKVSNFKPNTEKEWTSRQMSPPGDNCNCIYYSLIFAGVGFLLPYNSFIVAVDYFQSQYPDTTIVFDMNIVYIFMGFFAVLVNNLLVESLSLHTRITFGYIVSFITLLFVAVCEIYLGLFSNQTSYSINLVAMAVLAVGCTVQQSSFYGYTSMLPSRYTQAVMAGESAAGFFVSFIRVATKLMLHDQQENTLIFFLISIAMVGLCFALHHTVRRTAFIKYYIMLCQERKITLEPTEDAGLMEPLETESGSRSQYGVLKLQQSPREPGLSGFSFANPVYEPSGAPPTLPVTAVTAAAVAQTSGSPEKSTASGPSYKVEDVVVQTPKDVTARARRRPSLAVRGFRRGLEIRLQVAKVVWPYMLSIGLAYFITQCLYPGILSEIVSCTYSNWMPVFLFAMFNASDLLGKIIASCSFNWSRGNILFIAGSRACIVPLLWLCAYPRGRPAIPGEYYAMTLSIVLGITNGLVGSIPMIQAPSKVPEDRRELTGNIMTLSYNIGLTAGSLMSYILDDMLGPKVPNACTVMPAIVKVSAASAKINATMASFIARLPTNITTTTTAIPNTIGLVAATVMTAATAATSTLATMSAQSTASALTSTASHILKSIQPLANTTTHRGP